MGSLRKNTNTYSKKGIKSNVDFGALSMIESFEDIAREPETDCYGPGADAGGYTKKGWAGDDGIVSKTGWAAGATTGGVKANASVFGAYAEGPSAGVGAEVATVAGTPFFGASARAEASLCKAGVKAGPAVAEFNPNLNTGIAVSTTHVEANFLGCGASAGLKTYIQTPLGKIGFQF